MNGMMAGFLWETMGKKFKKQNKVRSYGVNNDWLLHLEAVN